MGALDAKAFGTENGDKSTATATGAAPITTKLDGPPGQDKKFEGLAAVHSCVSAEQMANVGRS